MTISYGVYFFQNPKAGLWASYDSLLSKYSRYKIVHYNDNFDMRKMKIDLGDETGQRSKGIVYVILITLFLSNAAPHQPLDRYFKCYTYSYRSVQVSLLVHFEARIQKCCSNPQENSYSKVLLFKLMKFNLLSILGLRTWS